MKNIRRIRVFLVKKDVVASKEKINALFEKVDDDLLMISFSADRFTVKKRQRCRCPPAGWNGSG